MPNETENQSLTVLSQILKHHRLLIYKATLSNGSKLAIKELFGRLWFGGNSKLKQSLTYVSSHGSLNNLWLHEKLDGATQFDWPTQLKITKGAKGKRPLEIMKPN
ncbi:hypothetical protein G4B88_022507 [Cannabis sativa]|uniref:Uncharacterized protein n=1 Tax=Cannabis sativa TaxID=3483 RepID=A0A7J6HVS4_CANSA|nr:hypothetical protein G4B88_022507 [Cannabis sativa]